MINSKAVHGRQTLGIGVRHRSRSRPLSLVTSTRLRSLLRNSVSRASTPGMPQDGKDKIEMVGVQADHETAHIFKRRANCKGFDESQMWRSPEDTACAQCAMTCASSQVITRSSVRSHG